MLQSAVAVLFAALTVIEARAQAVSGPQIAPASGPNAAAPRAAAPASQPKPAAAPLPAVEERMQLKQLTAEQFHTRIEKAFGKTLPPMADDGSGWLRFAVSDGQGTQVLIAAHQKTREVRMVGRPDQLRGWKQIIATMDAPAPHEGGKVTQLIAADKAAGPKIKQTVGVLVAQGQAPRANENQPVQQPQQPALGGANGAATNPNAIAQQAGSEGLFGPVEITNVEGTDFFVIRGNPRDVEKVMEVIRQIEAMSRVSEPQIVVHALKYVDADGMARLLAQMFAPAQPGGFSLAPFYGSLLPLPLGNPNAVLLIGGPGTVAKAEDLLRQLDVPGESLTQFEVFPLKNANAEQAQTVV
jgi:type II secretory pathway component GspD/PulD (secretin)